MNTLKTLNTNELILGATFLGTGGGGSPKDAARLFEILKKQNKSWSLKKLSEFKDTDLFVTAYGIGSIQSQSNPEKIIKQEFEQLTNYLKKDIKGIIPVEIGPISLATTCYLASLLGLPVIDADIVGGRSTPEVFLETITLFNIPRTPAIIANERGESSMLLKSQSPQADEIFFRNFAKKSNGQAYVVGYPMTKKQTEKSIEQYTVSRTLDIGKLLASNQIEKLYAKYNIQQLFEGVITNIQDKDEKGFLERMVTTANKKNTAQVYIKNENLILWINNKVALTCPDSIIISDTNNMPIYNMDLKVKQNIKILGMSALPLWRTKKGLELFNPKIFGFDIPIQLISKIM